MSDWNFFDQSIVFIRWCHIPKLLCHFSNPVTSCVVVEFWTAQSLLLSSVIEFENLLKVYQFRGHSIAFARWCQQHENGRVMLGFATHF